MTIETYGTRVELTTYGVSYTVRESHFTLDITLQFFFFQAAVGIRDGHVTGFQTCALPMSTTEGKTVSAKPIKIVSDASVAYGTCISSSNGINGIPNHWKTGVNSASISAISPNAITIGATPIHMSKTFCATLLKNPPILCSFFARFRAFSYP